jgi:ABC-type phosphate/phosphonate transport system substrate-binding protein
MAALPPAAADENPATVPDVVRIGMIRSFFPDVSEVTIQAMMRPFQALMETQTGLKGEMVAVRAEEVGRQLIDRKLDLAVVHGFELAWATRSHPEIKPLVTAVNSQKHLHAYLVVPAGSPVARFADLEGKKLALPRSSRQYTLLFLERRCRDLGKAPAQLCAQISEPADFDEALDEVVDGQADATVIDGISLANYQKRKPGRYARLKIAVGSEIFPAAAVVYVPGTLKESLLHKLRQGLIGASQVRRGQQLLMLSRLNGFEPVPADYCKQLDQILKAYPPEN